MHFKRQTIFGESIKFMPMRAGLSRTNTISDRAQVVIKRIKIHIDNHKDKH